MRNILWLRPIATAMPFNISLATILIYAICAAVLAACYHVDCIELLVSTSQEPPFEILLLTLRIPFTEPKYKNLHRFFASDLVISAADLY